MTTLYHNMEKCAFCGTEGMFNEVGSYSTCGQDIDTRNHHLGFDPLYAFIHRCRKCGYCSYDISNDEGFGKELLESGDYQSILSKGFEAHIGYEAYASLLSKKGDHRKSAWTYLRAAWCCDDLGECSEGSKEYRNKCVEQFALYKTLNETESIVRVDVLRRAGRFEEARKESEKLLDDKKFEDFSKMLEFEIELADKENTESASTCGLI